MVATRTPKAVFGGARDEPVALWPAGMVNAVGWPSPSLNWFGFVPPMATLDTTRSLPPVLVTVTDRAGVTAARAVLNTSRLLRPRTSSVEVTLMAGALAGAVIVKVDAALPVLPAPSVAVTTTVWLPAVFTVTGPV